MRKPFEYMLYLISNIFISNARLKSAKNKAKKLSKIISFPPIRFPSQYHSKIKEDILKNAHVEKKHICLRDVYDKW